MAFSLGEYQDIFLEEADEQLQELNQNLLELEKNPDDLEIINNIFRAAHSLKSSAAFVGLNDLSDLAHKMENLLQGIRDKTMEVSSEVVDVIFKCFDEINSVIDTIAAGEEPDQDLSWIISEIQKLSEKSAQSNETSMDKRKNTETSNVSSVPKTTLGADERRQLKRALDAGTICIEITVYIDDQAQMKWVKAQLVLSNLAKLGEILKTIPSSADLNDDSMDNVFKVILLSKRDLETIKQACNIDLVTKIDIKSIQLTKKEDKVLLKFGDAQTFSANDMNLGRVQQIESAVKANEEGTVSSSKEEVFSEEYEDEYFEEEIIPTGRNPRESDSMDHERKKISALKTVKVSVDKLDQLLNNVAELVIANSGYYKLYEEIRKTYDDKSITNEFKNRMEQMARIAKDLQSGIMKTRMVPIGQVFNRFNRLVRDLKKEFNKDIDLIIKGEDTELDKKVIDAIGEPLLHLIRNAIDHGIESSDERKGLGKPIPAHITLNAYQGGNQIFVEVSDDGRGLNIDDIKKGVVEKGLATIEMLAAMENSEIYDYIFSPGFSTAKKVTDISGRGVGMNVVKEIVNELNGNVLIETEIGMGTRFVMSFPLTLAIIPAIMVKIQHEMYAIPLSDVIETIKISNSDITTIEGHEVINLRGEILSLLRLSDFVGIQSGVKANQKLPAVVVGFGNRKIGLIVDMLEGKQEIVIKSLEQNYQTVEGLAGASILGDGSICLILDISSMINKVISEQDRISTIEKRQVKEMKQSIANEKSQGDKFKDDDEDDFDDFDYENEKSHEDETVEVGVVSTKAETIDFNELETGSLNSFETIKPEPVTIDDSISSLDSEDLTEIKIDSTPPVQETTAKVKVESSMGEELKKLKKMSTEVFDDPISPTKQDIREPEDSSSDDSIKDRVHSALEEFRQELKENVRTTMIAGSPSDHMKASLDISDNSLREFQVIANMGAANSAESLSKILNKRIDLSIPEITIKPTDRITEYLGDVDSIYIGIMMPLAGELKGTMLLILGEDVGFELIDLLYGTNSKESRKLDEDGESALKELLNILGSSVVNIFADKIGMLIKPDIPTIVHDFMQSIIDSILVMHKMSNDYTIIMDTAFYFESDKIIGNLLLLPEIETLKIMLDKMGSNV